MSSMAKDQLCYLGTLINLKYEECFNGIEILLDFGLKLHSDENMDLVAQRMYRVPYILQDKLTKRTWIIRY